MLHDLLRIKKIREKSAQDEVKKCQYKVEQSVIELEKCKKALQDHITWREQEETQLYDNIMNTRVKERDLDLLKQRIILMRDKDSVLEEEIQNAQKVLDEHKAALSEAENRLIKATQAVKKFEEFTRVLDEEAAREAERIEELEMEDFRLKKLY